MPRATETRAAFRISAPARGLTNPRRRVSHKGMADTRNAAVRAAGNGLERKLGLFSASNLVIANMIGAGIFTTSGLLLAELGSPLLMVGLWAAGGVLALCGALCYGELGAAMPEAGGEYVYLGELFHPSLGFLTGWVSFIVGFSAPLAASAIGCGEYIVSAVPALAAGGDTVVLKKGLALLVLAGLTAVHVRGIESGARLQNLLTGGKVLLILALVLAGCALGRGSMAPLLHPGAAAGGGAGWKSMGLALMWIMFAYSGWNAAAYVGSEVRDPGRTLPASLLLGTGLVTLLYLALNVLFVYAIPPGEMEGVVAVGGLAAERLFGAGARAVFSGLIGFALLSSISAMIILGPRVYYAMARDGYFFRFVAAVHPGSHVPARSIVLQSLLAAALVLTGSFDQILTWMGFCLGIFPVLAVLGVFRLRRSGLGRRRMPGFPAAPLVFAGGSVLMLALAWLERPMESTIAVITVISGIPFWFLFDRRRHP